jgi:energy-coupling factor transport system ATP-binding protein
VIKLKDLSFSYLKPDGSPVTETPQLNRINLEIHEGEFVLVCGPTGSGKSTLLKALNGLAPSFTGGLLSGEIHLDGQNLTGSQPHEYSHLVGYVNQQPEGYFVADTVIDEIVYGSEQLGLPAAQIQSRLDELVDSLEIRDLLDRPLATLSGGQQQRVAIAAALVAGQKVLLLDEPTSALDLAGATEVLNILSNLAHKKGITVLLAEHRISRVIAEVDSVLVVHGDGSVTKGKPESQFNDPRFAPPIIELGIQLGWNPLKISTEDAGKRWRESEHSTLDRKIQEPSSAIVEIKDLTVRFAETSAVSDVSLSIFGNQVTAIMGENGSGKTSLCWAIQGLGTRNSGSVILANTDTAKLAKDSRLDLIAMIPQRAADLLFLHTLADELEESDIYAGIEQGTTASLFQKLAGRIDTAIHPRDLSAGQQLALVLSIQLAKDAKVLILDEPTRGLDYSAKRALAKQLKMLRAADRAIILASHDIEFVAELADRVVLLEAGKIMRDSAPTELLGFGSPLASQLAQISRTPGLISIEQVLS